MSDLVGTQIVGFLVHRLIDYFSEITCQPLSLIRDGSIYPSSCTTGEVAFGTTCSINCHSGYSLIGPHSRQCLPEGLWTPAPEPNSCEGKLGKYLVTCHFCCFLIGPHSRQCLSEEVWTLPHIVWVGRGKYMLFWLFAHESI